jgi:hypothetical protein
MAPNGWHCSEHSIAPESDGMGESRRAWRPRREAYFRGLRPRGQGPLGGSTGSVGIFAFVQPSAPRDECLVRFDHAEGPVPLRGPALLVKLAS